MGCVIVPTAGWGDGKATEVTKSGQGDARTKKRSIYYKIVVSGKMGCDGGRFYNFWGLLGWWPGGTQRVRWGEGKRAGKREGPKVARELPGPKVAR